MFIAVGMSAIFWVGLVFALIGVLIVLINYNIHLRSGKDEELVSFAGVLFAIIGVGILLTIYGAGVQYKYKGTGTVKEIHHNEYSTIVAFEEAPPNTTHDLKEIYLDVAVGDKLDVTCSPRIGGGLVESYTCSVDAIKKLEKE